MATFQSILKLATGIQSIKRKYPMIVSYMKHLEKNCNGDENAEAKEVNAFKAWLLENPQFPTITSFYYKSSKPTICLSNVYTIGSEEVIAQFEANLKEINDLIFPDGRPEIVVKDTLSEEEMSPGVASAMAAIGNNPVFSGLLENIKEVVADTDIINDPSSILGNKSFKVLLKNIRDGIDTGTYKLADISSTINTVIGSVQHELDGEMSSVMSEAVGMMAAAERGQQPDVGRLMDLLKNVNFK